MTVFTIGYEGLSIDMFMCLLKEHGIDTVVDIRELPLSRKPGFSKRSLACVLNLAGFEYMHMVNLGCPKQIRDAYRQDGNWKHYTADFQNHLDTQVSAITQLANLVSDSNCALLCYEADSNFCHRSIVANALHVEFGVAVKHIKASRVRTEPPAESLHLVFA